MAKAPVKVVTVDGAGSFVWSEGLALLDFVPKGKRTPAQTWNLTEPQNTYTGALKKAGRLLAATHGSEWWTLKYGGD